MNAAPTYDQVAQLPALLNGVAEVAHLDENDHVNIQHYLVWAAMGVAERFETLGLGLSNIGRTGNSQSTAEQHLTYLSELRRGCPWSVRVRLVDHGPRGLHAISFVLDELRPRLSYYSEVIAINVSMSSRRTVDFGESETAAIAVAIAHDNALDSSAPLCGAMQIRRARMV